jgi:hypothetical protein
MRSLKYNNLTKNFKGFYNFPRKVFGVSQNSIDYTSKDNPRVFFTIARDGKTLGNLTFEV